MRIFLVGFMGVGKSTLGQLLADRLHMPFVDLDDWIEDKMEMPISEIFSSYGEPFFRKLEHDNLKEVIELHDRFVMGTGGGLPCFGNNMATMNQHGQTIYLRASVQEISFRLGTSSGKRPVLDAMDLDERERHIENLLSHRGPMYEQAHFLLDLELDREKEENVDLIEELLNRHTEEE